MTLNEVADLVYVIVGFVIGVFTAKVGPDPGEIVPRWMALTTVLTVTISWPFLIAWSLATMFTDWLVADDKWRRHGLDEASKP